MEKTKKEFFYLKQRKLIMRLDIFPFIIIHSIAMIIYTNKTIKPILKIIPAAVITLCQMTTFFAKFWSKNFMAKICYNEQKTIETATHVKVEIKSEKFKMNNRTVICKIERENKMLSIELEKIRYIYDKEKQTFCKNKFILSNKKLKDVLEVHSLTDNEVKLNKFKYGENRMKIPIPSFFTLYKEHMVAPFFVFQLFCILLWVFDDYGVHSLITLEMLCVFEATVVGQRIFNLATLRKMRVSPYMLYVYRNNNWVKIPSSELLPGDIVSVVEGSNTTEIKEEEDEDTKNSLVLKILKKIKDIKRKSEEKKNQKSMNSILNKLKDKEPNPLTCDMLLLSGNAIINEAMLTGESVPQMKDSITKLDYEHDNYIDIKIKHKNCVLFSGTKVVKVTGCDDIEVLPKGVDCAPPDNGCICMVIKTGFATSQGKLLRTVLYSSERVKGDSKEAFIFIAVLVLIALIASYYVLIDGLKREGELTYKLLLRCIIIITSVVPAELPIELSLAINNSLFFLQNKRIVCIEPFRIPFAGKIDTCCFDKTGTLTKDEFIMKGLIKPKDKKPTQTNDIKEEALSVILGCNSLISISNKPVGDPIEIAMFKEARGIIEKNTMTCQRKTKVFPIRKYQFDSNLKRMTVLARIYSAIDTKKTYNRVLCKGAPEVIKTLLTAVPDGYDECFNKWAKEGYRILSLAYADNNDLTYSSKREELEKNLIFCGFALVETPLKEKINKYMDELIESKYDITIITGDHFLTTTKVSKDLKIGPENFACAKIENNKLNWYDLDNKYIQSASTPAEVQQLACKYTLGITGNELNDLEALNNINNKHLLFQYIKLYCRVNPTQKDDIIKHLIKSGKNPSMCGDGSNDVGALKRAVIGIALLNSVETVHEKKQPFNIFSIEEDSGIKSGDATTAAPFTSKSGSIKCIKKIFIQGRCTLVVTFQMYKILALNCLLTAYTLSVLALKGVKFSDYQETYMGFVVAIFFLMLSKAEPLKRLNENRPPNTIFTPSAIISITGQAVVGLLCMMAVIYYTKILDPVSIDLVRSLNDDFSPSLMNTIVFLYSVLNQIVTIIVNYQGEPFMENVTKNGGLIKFLILLFAVLLVVIFEVVPQFNETLELVPLPEDLTYKFGILGIMFINFICCYVLENWPKLFGYYKIKK